MKEKDRIIWDSGFGYEIGYFVCDSSEKMMNTFRVDLVSGNITGEVMQSKDKIIPYTHEKIAELTKKYGYEKSFSEIF